MGAGTSTQSASFFLCGKPDDLLATLRSISTKFGISESTRARKFNFKIPLPALGTKIIMLYDTT